MIRPLVLITGASFVLAVVCFIGAAALSGGAIFHHHAWHGWTFDDGGWRRFDRHHGAAFGDGAQATREIAWTGGDSLELSAPADVRFTQAPGPGKLVITGPSDVVDQLLLEDGELRLPHEFGWRIGRVSVTMTAPAVSRFAISGDDSLTIAGYDQDQLAIDLSGAGSVKATGKVRQVRVDISGDGDVDLAQLAAKSAEADISGAGRATLAPTDQARLAISGAGEVDLLTRPPQLSTDVSGVGRIVESQPPAPAATNAPATPAKAA